MKFDQIKKESADNFLRLTGIKCTTFDMMVSLIKRSRNSLADTGYQGIHRLHQNSALPKKKTKKNPLTQEDKKRNRQLSSERVLNENVIGMGKRFKIISHRYRNRRKRFALRFNLIAGIYNFEL